MTDAPSPRLEPGVVPLDVLRTLDGMQFLQGLKDGRFPPAPIADLIGFDPGELEPGRVVFRATPEARHYNPLGTVHGGYTTTLLDSCMACAVQSQLEAGQAYTSLEIKVNFVRAMTDKAGPVRAEGTVIQVGRQIGIAEGKIYDAAGKLYAHGTTTCLIFDLQDMRR